MILPVNHDCSPEMENILHNSLRRRRNGLALEGQLGRCPLCNRIMILHMSRLGPAFHCGCPERKPRK